MGIPRNYVPKSQLSIGLEEIDLTQPNQKISQPSSKVFRFTPPFQKKSFFLKLDPIWTYLKSILSSPLKNWKHLKKFLCLFGQISPILSVWLIWRLKLDPRQKFYLHRSLKYSWSVGKSRTAHYSELNHKKQVGPWSLGQNLTMSHYY